MSGFYLMHRGWQDNPVFRNEEYSRRDAFVWLIEQAAYKAVRVHAGGGVINLARGQLSHSLRFMAKAWKWDEAKVRRFIASMTKEKIIDAATDAGQTVITICNYEKYQTLAPEADAAIDAETTQERRSGDAKNNEVNEVIQEEEKRESAPAVAATRPRSVRSDAFPRPDWADPSVWSDFLANRVKKRLTNTATAHRAFLADIDRITDRDWPPGRLLEVATAKGHGAIYPSIKEGNQHAAGRTIGSPSPRSNDGFGSAIREAATMFDAGYDGGMRRPS